MSTDAVVGVVLAAGQSKRFGIHKQLLPYRDTTLLGGTLDAARKYPFDQLIVTLGGAAALVYERVALDGVDVAIVEDSESGCSASLRAALELVDSQACGVVLLPADQPGVQPTVIEQLVAAAHDAPIAVCHYRDGIGTPFWLSRSIFDELSQLHGDKAVGRLIEAGLYPVSQVAIDADAPLDVDTWFDYERLLFTVAP